MPTQYITSPIYSNGTDLTEVYDPFHVQTTVGGTMQEVNGQECNGET